MNDKQMGKNIRIVVPLYNDWDALKLVLEKTYSLFRDSDTRLSFLIVNDCSTLSFPSVDFKGYALEILHLIRNLGHQRAIAIGISYLADKDDYEQVIVMDADGEDSPGDIFRLLDKSEKEPDKIIFAKRNKRSEGLAFTLFYYIYRITFKLLTGKVITFGNFCLIPRNVIRKLAFVSEIWNNFPGGIIRSRIPYTSVPVDRAARLAGKSKMNLIALILHGMSTVSVFLDRAAVRILIFVSIMITCSVIGTIIVLYLKFVTNEATPGWASSLILAFFIIFLQGFFITLFILFTVLSTRTNNNFIPLEGYHKYIDKIEKQS